MHVEIQSMADDEVKICSIDHRREREKTQTKHERLMRKWESDIESWKKGERKKKEKSAEPEPNSILANVAFTFLFLSRFVLVLDCFIDDIDLPE